MVNPNQHLVYSDGAQAHKDKAVARYTLQAKHATLALARIQPGINPMCIASCPEGF